MIFIAMMIMISLISYDKNDADADMCSCIMLYIIYTYSIYIIYIYYKFLLGYDGLIISHLMICPDPTTASRQADPSQTEVRPPAIFQQPDETVRLQYVDIWLLYG